MAPAVDNYMQDYKILYLLDIEDWELDTGEKWNITINLFISTIAV